MRTVNNCFNACNSIFLTKNYDHDTADLVLEALSIIYMHRIFIFENSIYNPPCGVIGEKFTNV